MTPEQKWDRLWIAACGVVSAYESSRDPRCSSTDLLRLDDRCATLKRVIDEISPDPVSAADHSQKEQP
jgi:hypothetical protein